MRRRRRPILAALAIVVCAVVVAGALIVGGIEGIGPFRALAGRVGIGTGTPLSSPPVVAAPAGPPVLIAAGDIATCAFQHDEATAKLVAGIPGTVAALGDNAYENGSSSDYSRCYTPSWGPLLARTRPVPGNHDYNTRGAAGYFAEYGAAAGTVGQGWYAYDLGSWRIYALNSNCGVIGGCSATSPEVAWLRADLADNPRQCVAAYWHHALFSSGRHGNNPDVRPIWQVLYDGGADVVLNGHDHLYERFAPQDPNAKPDPQRGIREFVVGTGGDDLYEFHTIQPNSEVRNATTFGVLKLTLGDGTYDWTFLPAEGAAFTDSGSGTCH